MTNRRTLLKIVFSITAIIGIGVVSAVFLYQAPPEQSSLIMDFNDDRDTADMLEIFTTDRPWLISSPDYDPAYALRTRSPNAREEQYKGKMTIKVLRLNDKLVGFVTYYMKSPIEGFILFLAVKPEFRGKRFGPQLIEYALNDLKRRGAHFVQLVTRTDNIKAQSVYKRTGFIEKARDDRYVFYFKPL